MRKFLNIRRNVALLIMLIALLGSVFVTAAPVEAVSETNPVQIAQAQDELTPEQIRLAEDLAQQVSDEISEIGVDDSAELEATPATCESSGTEMGWLLCPMLRGVYGFFDWLAREILSDELLYLELDVERSTAGEPNALYDTWRFFLTFANFMFVIAFLAIIYGMAAGSTTVMQSFSIQRMLPRLVLAVILAYLSIFIVEFLVDVTNDLGKGISNFILAPVGETADFEFNAAFGNLTDDPTADTAGEFVDNVVVDLAVLYGLGGIVAYLGFGTIAFYALLALLVVFLVLIFRVVVIVLLLILAPLAFAANILPNTESMFKMWYESLWKALIMYPLIMLFITSGRLAARLLTATSDNIIMTFAGIIAAFLPFFLIPLTFKLAGAALGTVGRLITGAQQKLAGDPRDPTSIRSALKRQRGANLDRLYSGEKKYFPAPIRAGLKRLPWTDPDAAYLTDLAEGRKKVEEMAMAGRDYLNNAISLTGGGTYKGKQIITEEGQAMWSARLKQGMYFLRDKQGNFDKDIYGRAKIFDGIDERVAKVGDFYDSNVMAQVRKHGSNRAMLAAATEYTIKKGGTPQDYERVLAGIAGSRWTTNERKGLMGGVAAVAKGQALHYKALETGDYLDDFKKAITDIPPAPKYNLRKLVAQYSDTDSFAMSRMDKASWRVWREEIERLGEVRREMDSKGVTKQRKAEFEDSLKRIGKRAYQYIDGVQKGGIMYDDDNRPMNLGSQVSASAAREAEYFYKQLVTELNRNKIRHDLPSIPSKRSSKKKAKPKYDPQDDPKRYM